jgi:hypothetical protein
MMAMARQWRKLFFWTVTIQSLKDSVPLLAWARRFRPTATIETVGRLFSTQRE